MDFSKKDYWVNFVEKLSMDNDMNATTPSILEDLCRAFGFGCGFIYESNHNDIFHIEASYKAYPDSLIEDSFDLHKLLSDDMIAELVRTPAVIFSSRSSATTELEKSIISISDANSMILVPAIGNDEKILALIGLMDRRKKVNNGFDINRRVIRPTVEEDMRFASSILNILANNIKMKIYRQQVENAQFGLEGVLDNMGIDVYVNDFDTHEILYLNRSMAAPYGSVEEMKGQICWKALYDDKTEECDFCPQKKLIDEDGNATKVYSWDYKRPFDGSWFRVFSAAFRWVDGRLAHIVSSVDISENKHNEEIIRQLAEYDHLTGLPNRYNLTQYIDKTIASSNKTDKQYYILFFDIDGFKQVNDTFGHEGGDNLLCKIGDALQSNPLTKGRSYRYGGDEFVIVVEETAECTINEIALYIRELFSNPWQLSNGVANVGA